MLDEVSKTASSRLFEVQRLLAHILSLETGEHAHDVDTARTLKGLFYVNLYGAFEYAVTQSVQVLLQEISIIGLPYAEFEHLLYSVVLDGAFKSVADVNSDNTWSKRNDLLRTQVSAETCNLDDTVFHMYLQNVKYKTLKTLFNCLCIAEEPIPDIEMRGYVNGVVLKRNEVAHGRSSPRMVGATTTLDDMKKSMEAISATINRVIESFDNHLKARAFVSKYYRHKYLDVT